MVLPFPALAQQPRDPGKSLLREGPRCPAEHGKCLLWLEIPGQAGSVLAQGVCGAAMGAKGKPLLSNWLSKLGIYFS